MNGNNFVDHGARLKNEIGMKFGNKFQGAKGAAKGSCGETVVQKGIFESPFLLCPLKVCS